ncbi:MAG: hypothetical protein KF754_16015 [Planctomycetes bacterium]|nr:hypothetical protein [Planctomycetota bacterium]
MRPDPCLAARHFTLAGLLAIACFAGGCASGPGRANTARELEGRYFVAPVQNLSGVSLRVTELYVGDMLGTADPLEVEEIDLALVTEAALVAGLTLSGRQVTDSAAPWRVQAAVTTYDAVDLRRTGRYRMALLVVVVDNATQTEIARGEAVQDFQLFLTPPGELGAIGDQRFTRRKYEAFTETLAREALLQAGLR